MLVLARKLDESIIIGENIVVKVVSIENGVVKLGIDAPKNVSIMRSELIAEVTDQNRAAIHISDENEISELNKLLGKK
jgi:carbon storage regulator CsrA